VKEGRLRCLWKNRGTIFQLPMVGGNQMEDVKPYIFRGRGKVFPNPLLLGEIAPERINQFDANGEMT
jgi:hypothetical protein